nr:hypothetical protein [Rhodococcus sp. (in: high G+C Gram-positive bacteria)]
MTELVDLDAERIELVLVIPETCPRGHPLEPRTVAFNIQTVATSRTSRRQEATSWHCVPCIRADVYEASTGEPAPAEILHASKFGRQYRWQASHWWTRVHFESGHQFSDADPTDAPPPAKRAPRKPEMSHSDPTSSIALREINVQRRAAPATTWRDYLDPFELPLESDRADVEAMGLDAWRESRAYTRYRRARHGAAA